MYIEARKINLIQEVLNIKSDAIIDQLEDVLKVYHSTVSPKLSIYDFTGKLTKEEAEEFEKVVKETSETIHPDDWK